MTVARSALVLAALGVACRTEHPHPWRVGEDGLQVRSTISTAAAAALAGPQAWERCKEVLADGGNRGVCMVYQPCRMLRIQSNGVSVLTLMNGARCYGTRTYEVNVAAPDPITLPQHDGLVCEVVDHPRARGYTCREKPR